MLLLIIASAFWDEKGNIGLEKYIYIYKKNPLNHKAM